MTLSDTASSSNKSVFIIDSQPSATVDGSADGDKYVTFPVSFAPTSTAQTYSGTITISTPTNGTYVVYVTGIGTATGALVQLSGDLDFGDVPFGSTATSMLVVSNPGTYDLQISGITFPSLSDGASFSFPESYTAPTDEAPITIPYSVNGTLAVYIPIVFNPGPISSPSPQTEPLSFGPVDLSISFVTNPENYAADTLGISEYEMSGTGIPVPIPVPLVSEQIITLADTSQPDGNTYYNYYTVNSMSGTTLTLTLMDLTGVTPVGAVIGVESFIPPVTNNLLGDNGQQFFTVDANEAGTTVVAGARMNGPIYRIIPQGDYAYIYKERSIQIIQYTGLGNGTFFIHNEISGEGLIGRNAVADRNDGSMVFLGHKELYIYAGGDQPEPICMQYTRQLYSELDRTRLDQIILFHNENRKEIWVQYPVNGGGAKFLIWNYVEDSAAIEIYDPSVMISAINWVDWSSSPTWAQALAIGTTWSEAPQNVTWEEALAASVDHAPLFGSVDGNLRIQGLTYDREGEGYLCLSETMDYDFGSPDLWKYLDVVVLALRIDSTISIPAGSVMYVQVGTQAALGGVTPGNSTTPLAPGVAGECNGITWSAGVPILVDGTQPSPVKVNPGGAGRYVRLRFYSIDPGCQWRISQFEIHARPGYYL